MGSCWEASFSSAMAGAESGSGILCADLQPGNLHLDIQRTCFDLEEKHFFNFFHCVKMCNFRALFFLQFLQRLGVLSHLSRRSQRCRRILWIAFAHDFQTTCWITWFPKILRVEFP